MILSTFNVLIIHLYMFFTDVFVKVFDPSFNQVVSVIIEFKSFLCILDNSPLSDRSFPDIFSHIDACLLVFLTMLFVKDNLFI